MDQFTDLTRKVRWYLFTVTLGVSLMLIGVWWLESAVLKLASWEQAVSLLVIGVCLSMLLAVSASNYVMEPMRLLWQAIVHVSPDYQGTPPPICNRHGWAASC